MMTNDLIHDHFLLENKYAEILYHEYAADLPIIDYHNHLPPDEIANNRNFENLTQIWLNGDHYKWRAMRAFGVNEQYITGNASDMDKFLKWSEAVPYTLRNPLYHWTHLELKRYFDIAEPLNGSSASRIYEQTQEILQQDSHSVLGLLKQMKVETLCTTDDPADSLTHHIDCKKYDGIKVLPTFRPDKALDVSDPERFLTYLSKLAQVTDMELKTYDLYLQALEMRHHFFHEQGCRISDHGLDYLDFVSSTPAALEKIFQKLLQNQPVTPHEQQQFKCAGLLALAKMDHSRGWVQQFHLGALRNTNTRQLSTLGPDTGFDSIGDFNHGRGLALFFDELDKTDQLAKTIIYNLNPADNELFAAMVGNFNDGSIRGKMQYGSGWWFLDQLDGMTRQLNALSNIGLISCFVGMLTDSRSFLSFPRHEYFRRLLCNIFGEDMEKGLIPTDVAWVGKIIKDICYHNAKGYFDF
ncbi:MAG: glucuronate isomerase [Bacteroidota bacterium]